MATIAELWETPAKAPSAPAPQTVPSADQEQREATRLRYLRQELANEQAKVGKGDAAAQARTTANIQSLQAEIGRQTGQKPAPAPQPTGTTIADLWEAPAAPAAVGAAVIPGWAAPAPAPAPAPEEPKPSFVADILQRYVGPAYRTARQVPAYVKGGLEAGVKIAEQTALLPLMIAEGGGTTPDQQRIARARQALSGYKVGPEGQQILETMGDVLSASKLPPYIATTGGPTVAAVQAGRQAPGMARETIATWKRELEPGKVTQPLSMQEAQAQFAARQGPGGSVGAAETNLQSRITELAARLPENEARQILSADPKKVDLEAAERRAIANKFGIDLTKGQAKQDLAMLGDEFNAKREVPEIQARLSERSNKLFQGLDQIKEKTAPDIYTSNKVELGQNLIDILQAKDAQRQRVISGLYKQLEVANAGALPIDTGKLLTNIESALSTKMRSRFAPSELMDTIRDASKRGSMTFEEFENLRTIAAEEIRSSKNGNTRIAASLIRDELEKMPLSTDNAQIKKLADQARAAAKARFDLIERNPAYKAAVKDTRTVQELSAGLESVGADKFLDNFIHNDVKQASVANVKRLLSELQDQPQALQALKAGTIEHLREKATLSGGYFGQAQYNKRMAALTNKVDQIFKGDQALVDLKDLGQVALWTEHARRLTGANVSESANVLRQMGVPAAEMVGTAVGAPGAVTTGVKVMGKFKEYKAEKQRQTQLKKMVEPGAGLIND